jgi:hypothetical protein
VFKNVRRKRLQRLGKRGHLLEVMNRLVLRVHRLRYFVHQAVNGGALEVTIVPGTA